ncbi:hypothetical protein RN001_005356 [Aquatica leii]|uniref:THAP-type domain-containing protein n=1 Tax=Aquatica leii TaxID=1421715 RepID=A0AAN7Q165_9COLE|nr:hypothetical protein RN001_005356 [Aquatica leii]
MDLKDVICKNKCCVSGCVDRISKRHRFPKDVSLLKEWVKNIKDQRLNTLSPQEIYSKYYVCDRNLVLEYLVPGTRRGLRRDASKKIYLEQKKLSLTLLKAIYTLHYVLKLIFLQNGISTTAVNHSYLCKTQ